VNKSSVAYRLTGVVVLEDPVGKHTNQVGVYLSVIKTNKHGRFISITQSLDK
jgi:hypothetical protein